MSEIAVIVGEGVLKVISPYNKEFVSFARMRGGKWSDSEKAWLFDPRDEFAIRSSLIDIFGTDDYGSCKKVDVRISLDHFKISDEFVLFGLQLLRRKYTDRRVDIDDRVIVISGGFPSTGGSRRYPEVNPEKGTIIEVRDIPQETAVKTWAESKEGVELLGDIDVEKLKQEKEILLKRISQIDQLMADLELAEERDNLADLYD